MDEDRHSLPDLYATRDPAAMDDTSTEVSSSEPAAAPINLSREWNHWVCHSTSDANQRPIKRVLQCDTTVKFNNVVSSPEEVNKLYTEEPDSPWKKFVLSHPKEVVLYKLYS